MRIDDRPLAFPIAAHLIAPVDVATFHSICPNDLGMHGRENALDVAAVEEEHRLRRKSSTSSHIQFSLLFHISNCRCGRTTLLAIAEEPLCQVPAFLHCGFR